MPRIFERLWTFFKRPASIYLFQELLMCTALTFTVGCFLGLQNIEGSLGIGDLGMKGLSVLYVAFALSCPIAPSFAFRFGIKRCLVLSLFGYIAFIAAHFKMSPYTILPSSALLGAFGPFLWASSSVYTMLAGRSYAKVLGCQDTSEHLGFFYGLSAGTFQLCQIFGNFLASAVLTTTNSTKMLFIVFTIVASIGPILMSFLMDLEKTQEGDDQNNFSPQQQPSYLQTIRLLLRTTPTVPERGFNGDMKHFDKDVNRPDGVTPLLLIPPVLYVGFEQSYGWAVLTSAYIAHGNGYGLETDNVSIAMLLYGISGAIASVLFGILYDSLGREYVIGAGTLCHASVAIFFIVWSPPSYFSVDEKTELLESDMNRISWHSLMIAASLWGIGDSSWNTSVSSVFGTVYPENSLAAFANFQFWQTISMVFTFAFYPYFGGGIHTIIELVLLFAAFGCIIYASRKISRLKAYNAS